MADTSLINRLTAFNTCLKCELSGKECNDNCPTQYDAGHMGDIIKDLDLTISLLKSMKEFYNGGQNVL